MHPTSTIQSAVNALGPGPLTPAAIARHLAPLFQNVLSQNAQHPDSPAQNAARSARIYLASHTLGRPLDQVHSDVAEAVALWATHLRDAWPQWLREEHAYRSALAHLLSLPRPDCVIPKASAGQALRAVLNTLPQGATVLTTTAEFASVDVVLHRYATLGRLRVLRVPPTTEALLTTLSEQNAPRQHIRLVVASHVLYATGAILHGLDQLALACREHESELLIDCYHSLGVLPVSMPALQCGYMIGGCYKYLRGGPGAAFLAIALRLLPTLQPLDVGWFAAPLQNKAVHDADADGDAWLDGTPAVLPYYQARSGLALVTTLGVDRLRALQLQQMAALRQMLADRGIDSTGANADHGAFVTVPVANADRPIQTVQTDPLVQCLAAKGIILDAREGRLRLCADCLVSEDELEQAATALAACLPIT